MSYLHFNRLLPEEKKVPCKNCESLPGQHCAYGHWCRIDFASRNGRLNDWSAIFKYEPKHSPWKAEPTEASHYARYKKFGSNSSKTPTLRHKCLHCGREFGFHASTTGACLSGDTWYQSSDNWEKN